MSESGTSEELTFAGRILDNVHGFIYYTETEEKIINTLLFKRLQSIKQLSIVNWVFPGSEHTRYIHSLGVMFIADKIAKRLNLSLNDRKIVRLAGLLHDIGHYPLSHVCELPYKESLESFLDDSFCQSINRKTKRSIDGLNIPSKSLYMEKSTGWHHERIGAHIVSCNKEIRCIIENECGKDAPDIISDMIIGNVERKSVTNPLLVQILHSELDADGIDYLMRDAMFSGTSFGAFELDQLIGCMEIGEYNGIQILCISPKGVAAADQYLINKFFSYSQIVFNKHISITEWMAQQIVNWMQRNNAFFPRNKSLESWVKSDTIKEEYVSFTDNFFWASLQNILDNPLKDTEPVFIKYFCTKLLNHTELEYVKNSEVKIVSNNIDEIKKELVESDTYKRLENYQSKIALFSKRAMSKQVPKKDFDKILDGLIQDGNGNPDDLDKTSKEDLPKLYVRRLMECICVKEGNEIHLLCEDKRSLMQSLYNLNIAILRAYDCDAKSDRNII